MTPRKAALECASTRGQRPRKNGEYRGWQMGNEIEPVVRTAIERLLPDERLEHTLPSTSTTQ